MDVIELQADDTLPDSTFVDCNAVIFNGTALICRSHLISRRKEVKNYSFLNNYKYKSRNQDFSNILKAEIIKSVLKKEGMNIVEINDNQATIDASDVLFTGREFFVGLSKRTNISGAKMVASTFPEYPVSIIKVPQLNNCELNNMILKSVYKKLKKGSNHLKAYISVAGPDLLTTGTSEVAKDIIRVDF